MLRQLIAKNNKIPKKTGMRHEFKYLCSEHDLIVLENQLKSIMDVDINATTNGSYAIKSVYFDDYWNTSYYDSIKGNNPREKFRIRIYNNSPDLIKLELKRKEINMTKKMSCKLTLEQCNQLIRGEPLDFDPNHPAILQKLHLKMHMQMMRPKVIVEYDRTPFLYKEGNVRITLDRNLRSAYSIDSFFKEDISARPIMPPGMHLLEMKFDEFLPDHIFSALHMNHLKQTSYSKYYLCRHYSLI